MRKAIAVVGSQFGDEGKGLMTDYFCRQAQEKPMVVRFNGGAQAGHTVVTPTGKRHVFHHYGAGTLASADTYLSKYFLVNPDAWIDEYLDLKVLMGCEPPKLYIHPDAPVTTIYDMFINQKLEESRKHKRHGSCGMGVNETMQRHFSLPLTFGDLASPICFERTELARKFALARLIHLGIDTDENNAWIKDERTAMTFLQYVSLLLEHSYPLHTDYIPRYEPRELIFEGAQGLLLDANNKQFFPHVTHSRTGLTNVIQICMDLGIYDIDVCYVARSYLTRHGAGPLPGEDATLRYHDDTNDTNEWQGSLRFAKQDDKLLNEAICGDIKNNAVPDINFGLGLALTHCDQSNHYPNIAIPITHCSYGPTADDISENMKNADHLLKA